MVRSQIIQLPSYQAPHMFGVMIYLNIFIIIQGFNYADHAREHQRWCRRFAVEFSFLSGIILYSRINIALHFKLHAKYSATFDIRSIWMRRITYKIHLKQDQTMFFPWNLPRASWWNFTWKIFRSTEYYFS